MKKLFLIICTLFLILFISFASSCDDDDEQDPSNEEEDYLGACCDMDDQCVIIFHEQCRAFDWHWIGSDISCTSNPCDDDDDEDEIDCNGNTAPTLGGTVWIVNDAKENYPAGAGATTKDIVGVGFIFEDDECNLIGGYGTAVLTVDGVQKAPQKIGPYEDYIGCSTNTSTMLIGIFFDDTLPAGVYDWAFKATDVCESTSVEKTGTFTIMEQKRE